MLHMIEQLLPKTIQLDIQRNSDSEEAEYFQSKYLEMIKVINAMPRTMKQKGTVMMFYTCVI